MPKLALFAIVLLLTASGCCGVRLYDPCFRGCAPGTPLCLDGHRVGGALHRWASHRHSAAPPAPIPPPHPKYHPVPTRPVFAPAP